MPEQETKKDATLDKIVEKIKDAENVLVALSDNPTVDEMAAAIGLTMTLDAAGKHATAIYSGKTPNVLEFLNPQETFETNTNSLQDFIIALNKEKADHLRYKVDGDFVKVYITPYRTTISEDDLEFSRGDFNVDLVIALNVAAATDLDGALKEHGRIMHDASAVNITMGPPGKFGEVEWIDTEASSISEMVTNLALRLSKDLDKGTATALMTGLVAATDRFSNEKTTPGAMVLAAKLMGAGADQQVIAANISGKVDFSETSEDAKEETSEKKEEDKSKISIDHSPKTEEEESEEEETEEKEGEEEVPAEFKETSEELSAGAVPQSPQIQGVTDGAGAAVTPSGEATLTMPQTENFTGVNVAPSLADQMVQQLAGAAENPAGGVPTEEAPAETGVKDYGKMIDEALAEPLPGEGGIQVGAVAPNGVAMNTQEVAQVNNPAAMSAPGVLMEPAVNNIPDINYGEPMGNSAEGGSSYIVAQPEKVLNPANAQPAPNIEELVKKELAVGAGPTVGEPIEGGMSGGGMSMGGEANPAMEPVPVPGGLPMPGQEILPPPPAPPVDFSMDSNAPEAPQVPEMPQVQMEVPEAPQMEQPQSAPSDNNSFQIPGM